MIYALSDLLANFNSHAHVERDMLLKFLKMIL